MLDRYEHGREFECDPESASLVTTSVRNLGVVAQGNQGGMWVLPTFSPEIPLEISRADAEASNLADFILLAHKKGIRIPDSIYTTTSELMTQQFANYARSQVKNVRVELPLDVSIVAVDKKIEFAANATDRFQGIYQLKDSVERLNAASPGLGWFITDTIRKGHGVGLTTYDPCRIANCVQLIWFDSETDQEAAAEVLDIDEKNVTEAHIEQARDERTFMPSDFLASVGGHKHLLSWSQTKKEKAACRSMSASRVRACIHKLKLVEADRALVMAALEFHDSIKVRKANAAIAPNGWFEHENLHEFECLDALGSLAFIVWDDSEFAREAITHYEEYAMNGEGSHSQLVGLFVELDEPASWGPFIDAYKLYIKRYAAFSNFIGALPEEE